MRSRLTILKRSVPEEVEEARDRFDVVAAEVADEKLGTVRGRAARRGDAARAGADDQVVEVPASVATGEFAVAATA